MKRRLRQNKRPSPFLSRARAFWRLARKAQVAGNRQQQDWYGFQAQRAYDQYRASLRRFTEA